MSLRGVLVLSRSSLLITWDCFVGKCKSPPRNDIQRIAGNEYNHRMRLLFVTDARSPISQNWIRYFAKRERSDEIYIASTFQCELDFPVKRLEFTPVAFSAAKKQTSLPGSASSRTLRLRTLFRQWFGPLTIPRSAALRKLRAFIREVQPDIVHTMRVPYEGMLTASAMKGVRSEE